MEKRRDITGKIPEIWDKVAYNPPRYKGLVKAIVIDFNSSGGIITIKDEDSQKYLNNQTVAKYTPRTGFVICN